MPPKKEQKTKQAKALAAMSSSRSKTKKKKWARGRVKDVKNNAVVFDQDLYDRIFKEVPKMKTITTATLSERYQIRGSLARKAIDLLEKENLIKRLIHHSSMRIYTKVAE